MRHITVDEPNPNKKHWWDGEPKTVRHTISLASDDVFAIMRAAALRREEGLCYEYHGIPAVDVPCSCKGRWSYMPQSLELMKILFAKGYKGNEG